MSGRHEQGDGRMPRARWLVGLGALLAAALTLVFSLSPAGAATTVNAQLSLSGVATKDNVLGGSQLGVHPGDTVDFKASALPTAGLENVPALGSLLEGLLGGLTGAQFQVKVTFASDVPGVGGKTVALGGPTSGNCAGKADQSVTFPKNGTYKFTWTVSNVLTSILGCSTDPAANNTQLNQLKGAGVAINASNQYVGSIVVADNPPKGGISIQLPTVKVAPSAPIVGNLPTITIPGVGLPTIHASIPNLLPSSSGAASSAPAAGHSSSAAGLTYSPPAVSIPELVMPKGGGGGVVGGTYNGTVGGSAAQGGAASGSTATSAARAGGAGAGAVRQNSSGQDKTVDLSAQSTGASSSSLPVILALVAILALALVAGTYARLFLTRKPETKA